MDPWLERYWNDVHHTIIQDLADQLSESLPNDLYVSVEERVYVVEPDSGHRRHIVPDVAVVRSARTASGGSAGAVVGLAEPIRIKMPDEPATEGFIQIREMREGNPLVTAIEVISPTNKLQRQARAEYLNKREEYYRAKINVVELDLLRSGRHLIGVPLAGLDPVQLAPYKCAVRRGGDLAGFEIEYYPLPLRQGLPRIAIPLRQKDDDVALDLQRPIDRAYHRGRYGMRIDYGMPPVPPLSPEDAAWAVEMIAAQKPDGLERPVE